MLSAVLPEDLTLPGGGASRILLNKLKQIVSKHGMGGGGSRHILTCDVNEISKDITPTAPPMIAYNLGITFYIGDGQDGTLFTSDHMTLKGVGVTETKAYISALKRISTSNAAIKSFVEEGKRKILEYYERKCEYTVGRGGNVCPTK